MILGECLLCIHGDLADWVFFISGSEFVPTIPHHPKDRSKQIDVFSFFMSEFDEF